LAHLVHLVDDLLDVSRISRGKIQLRREPLMLAEIVENAVETCSPTIQENGHELSVTVPDEPIVLHGDRTRLVQTLCNLINNAAKYTEPGGRIWLAAQRQDGQAVMSVRDNGVGIGAEVLPNVFDMFVQGDRSLEKTRGGLGLGLTIVKRLVEMHGGTVDARSAGPGQGSEFVVRLPVSEAQPVGGNGEVKRPAPGETDHQPGRLRILVVDDNPDAAASLGMLLTKMGHEVRTAHNGIEAFELAAQQRPDLIFMDIGRPKLNGLDTTRRIRQAPWGQDIVIVALTGWGQDDDKRKSKEAGCDDHLIKPASPSALQKILAEAGSARQPA
jgi:CheY-like chemotaxis protein